MEDNKKQNWWKRWNKYLLWGIGIVLLFGTMIYFNENVEAAPSIGFEYLDDSGNIVNKNIGTVIHIWNNKDDYFFNKTSGLQFSNNFNEYWTKNVFCVGEVQSNNWNWFCIDELPYEINPITDNATYVNLTLTRNITSQVIASLTYNLKQDNEELIVNPRLRNNGNNINGVFGFAWKVKDIKILNTFTDDKIEYLTDEKFDKYYLNGNISFNTSNLQKREYTLMEEKALNNGDLSKAFVKLRWDNDFDYVFRVNSEPSQYNAPVTVELSFSGIPRESERTTNFFWRDPLTESRIRIYNRTGGNLQIFNFTGTTAQQDLPPVGTEALNGVNVTTCIPNIDESNNLYCTATSTTAGREPWIRFQFDIKENRNLITQVKITMEATSTGSAAGENANFIHRNFSNDIWSIFAAPARTTDATRTITYTQASDIQNVINASGSLMLLGECANGCDAGELIRVDFVQIEITYTATINSEPYFLNTYPILNSTDLLNYVNKNLTVSFVPLDNENTTLLYNVTWFKNNLSQFTIPFSTSTTNNNTMTTQILDYRNLTGGETWKAQVGLFDGQYINYTNTSELLIKGFGQLIVNITSPINNTNYSQGDLFYLNATITCGGNSNFDCGTVYANARYNGSSAFPDTLINTSEASPFYVSGGGEGGYITDSWDIVKDEGDGVTETSTLIIGDTSSNLYINNTYIDFHPDRNITITNLSINVASAIGIIYPINVTIWLCDDTGSTSTDNCLLLNGTWQPLWQVGFQNITIIPRNITKSYIGKNYTIDIRTNKTDGDGSLDGLGIPIENSEGSTGNIRFAIRNSDGTTSTPNGNFVQIIFFGYNETLLSGASPNPQSQALIGGQQMNVTWVINFSGNGAYKIDTLFNSSLRTNVVDNATTPIIVCVGTSSCQPQAQAGNTAPTFTFNPQLNSTTGINTTAEDLFVIFKATDTENTTLKYNITWFTNNRTNFTTTLYNYPIDTLNVTLLDKNNLTAGQTWRAMVNLWDGEFITRANTTELLILSGNTNPYFQINPIINSTNGLNQTDTNLNIFFTSRDNETTNLNYSIMVFRNNITNFSLYNIPTTNNTFTNFVINNNNLTTNTTWKAQVWTFDGTANSTLVNTTELLILDTPCSLDMVLSSNLSDSVYWDVQNIPITNLNATANNGSGATPYFVSITATGCNANIQIKANTDLTSGGFTLPLVNEKWAYNRTENTVFNHTKTSFTTSFVTIDSGISIANINFKFYLNVSANQQAGRYNNTLTFNILQT